MPWVAEAAPRPPVPRILPMSARRSPLSCWPWPPGSRKRAIAIPSTTLWRSSMKAFFPAAAPYMRIWPYAGWRTIRNKHPQFLLIVKCPPTFRRGTFFGQQAVGYNAGAFSPRAPAAVLDIPLSSTRWRKTKQLHLG